MENKEIENIKNLYSQGKYAECFDLCNIQMLLKNKNQIVKSYAAACLLKTNKYEDAINIYNKIITEGDPDFSHYVFRGDCFYRLGKYELAIQDFIASLKIDPKAGASWQRVAEAYFMKGDYEEAHINIDRAIIVSGENRECLSLKALFFKLQGKKEDAFLMFEKTKKKYPDDTFLINQQFELVADQLL